jgi:hypothetical protein
MKLLGQCLAALAFVAAGVFLIRFPTRHGLAAQVVGAAAVAFFGAAGVSVLLRLLRPGPAVVIDDAGIIDDASGVSLGRIPWDQVGEIAEYRVNGQAFLNVMLRDQEALIAQRPFWKRRLIRANLRMGAAAVTIPQASVGTRLSDLRREMERLRARTASGRREW